MVRSMLGIILRLLRALGVGFSTPFPLVSRPFGRLHRPAVIVVIVGFPFLPNLPCIQIFRGCRSWSCLLFLHTEGVRPFRPLPFARRLRCCLGRRELGQFGRGRHHRRLFDLFDPESILHAYSQNSGYINPFFSFESCFAWWFEDHDRAVDVDKGHSGDVAQFRAKFLGLCGYHVSMLVRLA